MRNGDSLQLSTHSLPGRNRYQFMKRNETLKALSQNLRKNQTEQERRLWYQYLRNHPCRFRRQYVIGNYIVDFYCHRARLVIELDGSQHYTSQGLAYDRERTAMLSKYDLSVLRFTNYDIDHHFDAVCRRIDNEIQTRISLTFGESSPTTDHH